MTEDKRKLAELLEELRGEPPEPAIVDGKPLVIGVLPDGRPIFVARNSDGLPWKDDNGEYVVIDPQTNEIRFKQKRSHMQAIPRMKDLDQVVLVEKQLKQHPPGFLAFARAVRPVKKLTRTLQQKVYSFFAVVLGIVGWFDAQVQKAVIAVRRVVLKVANKIRPLPASINMIKVPGIERYLSNKARNLLASQINSTLYQTTHGDVSECRYANMRVPLEPDGSIHDEYVRRWANFLNDMAARDIWKYGTLAQPSALALPIVTLRWEAQLITFFFTDHKGTLEELNELVGFPVFGAEGTIDTSSDWENFPW